MQLHRVKSLPTLVSGHSLTRGLTVVAGCALLVPLAVATTRSAWSPAGGGASNACNATALAAHRSCFQAALSDLWLSRANCLNLPQPDRTQCMIDALVELDERFGECRDQNDARLDLCERLGGGIYDPLIDPANFTSVIDNPYLPLTPGTTLVYEKSTDDGLERIEYIVTHQTTEILGVECIVVHDIVTVDDVLEEDTFDWFAQDALGNVWYFGEFSFEYDDGQIAGMSGSWKSGVDSAKPGIVMLAAPSVGSTYRQEFLIGEAEDAAAVVALGAQASTPAGLFPSCLVTEEFTPLTPDALEHKYYAPGVGMVLEVNVQDGSRTELVEIVVE